MKVLFNESCAGTNFMYSRGEVVESDQPDTVLRLKELVRAGHATEVVADKKERASTDLNNGKIEKR